MNEELLVEAEDAIFKLIRLGYAVVAFNPEELEGADPDKVTDRLIELGWDVISSLKPRG